MATTMWSFGRLTLLCLALGAVLVGAVISQWLMVEVVTGLALLGAVSLTVFRAIIDSLLTG